MRGATIHDRIKAIETAISTHTPLARRDCISRRTLLNRIISTHTPLARRDGQYRRTACVQSYFYSHASCEARRKGISELCEHSWISTHAPLARRDEDLESYKADLEDFYSRASREARRNEGGMLPSEADFYSRASREARPFLLWRCALMA